MVKIIVDPEIESPSVLIGRRLLHLIQHWNPKKYWKRRAYVVNPQRGFLLVKVLWLFWIKRIDAYHNCSFGTNINNGARISTPPHLPHGPNGIIVGHNVSIGKNVTIYQQVTVAAGAIVGDNVILGAGAKVLEGRIIGNNCKIGANCVVVENVSDDCTVVLNKPRIIFKNKCEF